MFGVKNLPKNNPNYQKKNVDESSRVRRQGKNISNKAIRSSVRTCSCTVGAFLPLCNVLNDESPISSLNVSGMTTKYDEQCLFAFISVNYISSVRCLWVNAYALVGLACIEFLVDYSVSLTKTIRLCHMPVRHVTFVKYFYSSHRVYIYESILGPNKV